MQGEYQRLTQQEHVIVRPDMYVGSVQKVQEFMWVYDVNVGMNFRKIEYVPGLYKIIDEILSNATDCITRDSLTNQIEIQISKENSEITIKNNGKGIPIKKHEKEDIWIPELIFGHLLTSSNYNDKEKKLTGGRNGYGAKLTNIFSKKFKIEIQDIETNKKYSQTWENNMKIRKEPKINQIEEKIKNGYTKIIFQPDLKLFQLEEFSDDFISLITKRICDISACFSSFNKEISVSLNSIQIPIDNF